MSHCPGANWGTEKRHRLRNEPMCDTCRAFVRGYQAGRRAAHAEERHTVDEIAVARRLAGDTDVHLTFAERRELVRQAHRRGMNDQQIRRATGLPDRTAWRIRHELGLPPVTPRPVAS